MYITSRGTHRVPSSPM